MMELYENGCDLNFNFAESFDAKKKNCGEDGRCAISDSYETSTGIELDTMSHKQRNQANARERYRTHRYWFSSQRINLSRLRTKVILILQSSLFSVNSAFSTLRLLIPTEPKNRKLSKIETLRLAKSYIAHLSATLMIGKNKTDDGGWFIVSQQLRKYLESSTVLWGVEQERQLGPASHHQHLHVLCFLSHSSKTD